MSRRMTSWLAKGQNTPLSLQLHITDSWHGDNPPTAGALFCQCGSNVVLTVTLCSAAAAAACARRIFCQRLCSQYFNPLTSGPIRYRYVNNNDGSIMHTTFGTVCDIEMQKKKSLKAVEGKRKRRKVGLCLSNGRVAISSQGSVLWLCALSGSECAVESFLSTLTQIVCCTLQANLMEDSYSILCPWQACSLAKRLPPLTELVTRPEKEPSVSAAREVRGREGRGAAVVTSLPLH